MRHLQSLYTDGKVLYEKKEYKDAYIAFKTYALQTKFYKENQEYKESLFQVVVIRILVILHF